MKKNIRKRELYEDDTTDDLHIQTEDLLFNIYIFFKVKWKAT